MEMREREQNGTKAPDPSKQQKDPILNAVGAFGKYQFGLCCIIFLVKFPVAFQQMAIIFLAPEMHYSCPPQDNDTCPCPNPIYDTSTFQRTMTTEWDLICDKKWMTSFTQTSFQFGTLLGSVLFGMASDRFGRKPPLTVSIIILTVVGIAVSYVRVYWIFTFMRFLIGISIGGSMVTSFVIVMEFVGSQYRDVISALYQAPFNVGHMLLPVFGYYFRNFTDFQLALSIPIIILLSYICLVPETPRWLLTKKRTDEAIHILERVAKINSLPIENIKTDIETYQNQICNDVKKGTMADLFRTPNIRRNICAMSFNWLTCSYCFYGVSEYVGHLSGNIFYNVAASASFSLVGTFLSIPLMKVVGRKTVLMALNLVCAICLLILAIIPEGIGSVLFACIGVVSSFVVFIVVYLYSSELFPTVVRNAAIGVASMMARVGSMIAPFVVRLRDNAIWMPPVAFAVLPLIAVFVTMVLPETKGYELMNTIEEGENFGEKSRKSDSPTELKVQISSM